MTAAAFNTLSTGDQIKMVLEGDALVGHRGAGPKSMHLYLVADFYVEVVFTTRKKEILSVQASGDDAILEPYLEQIDLTELFI